MLELEPNKFRQQFTRASHVWWILNKPCPATVRTSHRHRIKPRDFICRPTDQPTNRQRMWYTRRSTADLTLFQLHRNTITRSANTKQNKLPFVRAILVSGLQSIEHSWQRVATARHFSPLLSDNPRIVEVTRSWPSA